MNLRERERERERERGTRVSYGEDWVLYQFGSVKHKGWFRFVCSMIKAVLGYKISKSFDNKFKLFIYL